MSDDVPFEDRVLIGEDDTFLPEEKPADYPPYSNYKRDREAARLKAIGWGLEEIAAELRLTDAFTAEPDPKRAAAAVRRGLALVHQVTVDEKRMEQLNHYELLKRRIHASMDRPHVLVQQGRVILQDGVPVEDARFILECIDRLNRLEESISKLLGTHAAQRFSVEADQLGSEISQLIAAFNTDSTETTYTVEREQTAGELE